MHISYNRKKITNNRNKFQILKYDIIEVRVFVIYSYLVKLSVINSKLQVLKERKN